MLANLTITLQLTRVPMYHYLPFVQYSIGMQRGTNPAHPYKYIQTVSEPKHFFAYDLEGSGTYACLHVYVLEF